MTWQDILDQLEALCPVYELAAPGAVKRCIVWHAYGEVNLWGDDVSILRLKRIQIDILTQSSMDTLTDDVVEILDGADVGMTDVESSYDPDYALWRSIIQIQAEYEVQNGEAGI